MARYMMILYTVCLWGWYFGSTSIDDMTWDEMPGNMQLHAVAIVAIIAPDWHLDNNWTTRCCNMLLYNFWIFLAISGTSNICVRLKFLLELIAKKFGNARVSSLHALSQEVLNIITACGPAHPSVAAERVAKESSVVWRWTEAPGIQCTQHYSILFLHVPPECPRYNFTWLEGAPGVPIALLSCYTEILCME